jgi:PEP-CTERM motif
MWREPCSVKSMMLRPGKAGYWNREKMMTNRMWANMLGAGVMLVALVSLVPSASASLLSLGDTTAPDIFGVSPGGTKLADTTFLPYSTSVYSGHYESMVFSDPANPRCAGCLDFVYMFTSDATSIDPIHRATVTAFTGFETDVGYDNNSTGTAPQTVDRTVNGAVVGFNFLPMVHGVDPGVPPGGQSRVLVVYTNATTFAPGTLSLIDGQSINLKGFQPTVVPEPGTLLLLGSGLAGLVGSRFVRKRRA